MQVSELAKEVGVTADTVRFYTREGFLKPTRDKRNRYKKYSDKDLQRLRFIANARQLGFTVEDIEHIIVASESGSKPCPLMRQLISTRLQQTARRYQEMLKLRERLYEAVDEWHKKPDAPTGTMICDLIEDFVCENKKAKRRATPVSRKLKAKQ